MARVVITAKAGIHVIPVDYGFRRYAV
jgi:hypothetical protein